jgi:hypothetical protein
LKELANRQEKDVVEEEHVLPEEREQGRLMVVQEKVLEFALCALRKNKRIPSSVAPITELQKQ